MPPKVTIDIDLKDQKIFNKITDQTLQNPGEFLKAAARTIVASWWGETFRQQGARRGHSRWRPLSPQYLLQKLKKGRSPNILHLTGHLMGSNELIRATRTEVTYGTRVPYADFHQAGGAVRGRPPKREIVFVTAGDQQELEDFLSRLIQQRYDGPL